LGGARFHTAETGMADRAYEDDEACLDGIREFLSYLPRNARRDPSVADPAPPDEATRRRLTDVMPADHKKGYDVYAVIEGVTDDDGRFEFNFCRGGVPFLKE
jgi:propionyl-CoA carboxylase beta chain/acetyl-CoA/propionyl-CoA carboxylase carboxyl transferase subunit